MDVLHINVLNFLDSYTIIIFQEIFTNYTVTCNLVNIIFTSECHTFYTLLLISKIKHCFKINFLMKYHCRVNTLYTIDMVQKLFFTHIFRTHISSCCPLENRQTDERLKIIQFQSKLHSMQYSF